MRKALYLLLFTSSIYASFISVGGGGGGGVSDVTGTAPIASSGGTTPAISITNAAADGSTKGASSFTAADFNASSGNISLDYTNAQASSTSNKGFLTSADWNSFNNKGIYGRLTYTGASSCIWSLTNPGASWTSFSADTDCSAASVTGSVSAPATKIPGFVYSPPAGTYLITAQTGATVTSTALCSYSLTDGTNRIGRGIANSTSVNINTLIGAVTYATDQSSLTVQLQTYQVAGSGNCEVYDDNSDFHTLQFTVVRLN